MLFQVRVGCGLWAEPKKTVQLYRNRKRKFSLKLNGLSKIAKQSSINVRREYAAILTLTELEQVLVLVRLVLACLQSLDLI
jgi:hypothetical protein